MKFLTTQAILGAPAGRVVVLADDAIPSRYLIPLDELAVAALKLAKEAYVEDYAFRLSQAWVPQTLSQASRDALLHVPAIPDRLPDGALPEIDLRPREHSRSNRAADLK